MKQEMIGGSSVGWIISKSFAPHSMQRTMLTSHH